MAWLELGGLQNRWEALLKGPLNGHPKFKASAYSSPEPPQRPEIEGRGQQRKFGLNVGQAAEQEPPRPHLLLEDSKYWLYEFLAPSVPPEGRLSGHPLPVLTQ